MPHTVNGIGTWYHGKANVETYTAECDSCHKVGVQSAYDTRLFFVIVFLPIIPLKRLHVFDECPYCQRHRAVPKQEWDAMRARLGEMRAAYQADAGNAEAAREAMGMCVGLRRREEFIALAQEVEQQFAGDVEMLRFLSHGYDFFGRNETRERVLRQALAVQDDDESRELLAKCLLDQERADEAEPLLAHIVEQGVPDRVGLLYWLAQVFQLHGNHAKALAYFTRCETINPRMAQDADFVRLRDFSAQHEYSGEAVKPVDILNKAKREKAWQRFVRLAPVVAVLAVLAYLGVAWFMGQSRTVYLVNGLDQQYTVWLNGEEYLLRPKAPLQARVSEGPVEIKTEMRAGEPVVEKATLSTPLLTRPFVPRTIVINPDGAAVLVQVRTYYSADDDPVTDHDDAGPTRFEAGKPVMLFTGVEFPFQPFPKSIKMDSGTDAVARDRLTLLDMESPTPISPMEKIVFASKVAGRESARRVAEAYVRLHPTDLICLSMLARFATPAQQVEFLQGGLDREPLHIEWHRFYQNAMSELGRDNALITEYDARLAKSPNDPVLIYLAGRVQLDLAKTTAMFRRAVAGPNPCAYAYYGLGGDALTNGRFADAVAMARKAGALQPANLAFLTQLNDSLMANGQYQEALQQLSDFRAVTAEAMSMWSTLREIELYSAMKQPAAVQAAVERGIARATADAGEPDAASSAMLRGYAAYFADNTPEYLTLMKGSHSNGLAVAITEGDVAKADKQCNSDPDSTASDHLLVYLLAAQQGHTAIADAHLQQAAALMAKADYDARCFAAALQGKSTLAPAELIRHPLATDEKAIVLTALGMRDPQERARYFALARKLNFSLRFPHYFLQSIMKAGQRGIRTTE